MKSLNTLATMATLIVVSVTAYMIFTHAGDAVANGKEVASELKAANKEAARDRKEANKEQADLLKELGRAAREQNCLIATGVASLPPERRLEAADLCKRIAR